MTDELENPAPEADGDKTPENEGEKPAEVSNEMKTALAQKEHFRAKAEKLEAELKKVSEQKSQPSGNIDALEITRLGKSISQYDDQETDFIIERAKGKFNTLSPNPSQIVEASKDQWTQEAILNRRAKAEKERALNPSNKQPDIKQVPKNLEQQLEAASLEEAEKILLEKGLIKFPNRKHSQNILREGLNR
jgi:hypothetical protein